MTDLPESQHLPNASKPDEAELGTAHVLVLDTASPTVSVALGRGSEVLAERREGLMSSSVRLLPMIEECLREAKLQLDDLEGLVALSGPGSFTGLRVGMATAMGLYQSGRIRVTTLPTFHALAEGAGVRGTVFAVVDVMRGDWAVQEVLNGEARGKPERIAQAELRRRFNQADDSEGPPRVRGFGVGRLAEEGFPGESLLEPEALASDGLRHFARCPRPWDPAGLTQPLYFRPPAATPLGPPKRLLGRQFRAKRSTRDSSARRPRS